MAVRRIAMTSYLIFVPMLAAASDNLIVYTGGCEESEVSADVLYAADQNADYLKSMAVAITVDEDRKRCGYDLQRGKKIRHLKSGLTDIDLHEELAKFFARGR